MKKKEDKVLYCSIPLFVITSKDKTYTQMYSIRISERSYGKDEAKRRKEEKRR